MVNNVHISINNAAITRVSSTKFLGIWIDERLCWSEHCGSLVAKLNSLCYLFRNLRGVLTVPQLITVYHAQIGSRLRYGVTFWGSSTFMADVLVAQKRVLRCLAGLRPRESCREVFKSLGILTVVSVYVFELAVYIHKNKHKYLIHRDVHDFNTRGRDNYYVQFRRLDVSRRSPDIMGLHVYNGLPKQLKQHDSLNIFKRELKLFLLGKTVYCLTEFYQFCGGG